MYRTYIGKEAKGAVLETLDIIYLSNTKQVHI